MELEPKGRRKILPSQASVGVCRGALGELYQGISTDGSNEIVIISSLIPKYSWTYFTPDTNGFSSLKDQKLASPEREKSFTALKIYCQQQSVEWPSGRWSFYSDLQVARGMASSTADIVATLRCAASYFGKKLTTNEILSILSKLERSDSVFLDRLALFSSSKHEIIHQFKKMPPLYALYMHEADEVETDGTKTMLLDFYQQHYRDYLQLNHFAQHAFQECDLQAICKVATLSAQLSQQILPKLHFEQIMQAQKKFDADGVITAHTGSVIGLLYAQKPNIKILENVAQFYKELGGFCQYTEIGA
ncbi:GHMP family kinase ATP-binding protein [Thalassotalea ganghwensis]